MLSKTAAAAVAGVASLAMVVPATSAIAKPMTPVSAVDAVYLKASAAADFAEISLGKVALTKSSSADVTAVARKLITDHTMALKDTRIIAKALHVKLPTGPTPAQKKVAAAVSAKSGSAFDVAYLKAEVAGHIVNIANGKVEVKEGFNARVRANAKMSGPMLRYHLWLTRKDLKKATA